jgi:drug/metabolite transporter (DMT)-like permease
MLDDVPTEVTPIRFLLKNSPGFALITGLGYAVILYGYLGAVNYLPVNQVILIYFIHPLLVGLITTYLGHERLTWIMIWALIAALLGFCLTIGLSFQSLDLVGIGLATLAMVVTALVIVANAPALTGASATSIGFFMMLSAAVALAILFALFGTLALPTTTLGWTGFIGVAVAATTGTLSFVGGMAYVGATRAAVITNLEPVLGVLFALAVLKERITFYQGLGIAVVIGSILCYGTAARNARTSAGLKRVRM